ncbi:antA/AntB antirepressor family protein [Avibacterium paragallinarum]|uniref:antA/AntB antirepressor family protein n=1 Tax=Avibacterium paragallinarum TaxID=728 RepID=UPI00397C9651
MKNFSIKAFNGSLQNQTVQLINARDLHKLLENGKQFSDWIQHRITKYKFTENLDFTVVHQIVNVDRGFFGMREETIKDYHITLDMAKELCMLERSVLGQQARRYFIQMEKAARQLAQQQKLDIPTFIRNGQSLPLEPNHITIDKDRYIALLESENSLLKSNHGKPLHPRKGQRLDEAEKSEIRRLYAQGIAKAAIARQINRSECAVSTVLKG